MKLFEIRKNGTTVACGTRRAMDAVGRLYEQPHTYGRDPHVKPILDEIGDTTRVRHWSVCTDEVWFVSSGGRTFYVEDRFELHAVPEPMPRWVPDAAWYAAEARRERARFLGQDHVKPGEDPYYGERFRAPLRGGSELR
ncbi:MAG: hypothetical protein WC273_10665 [Dehalococcoidia bacterium]